MSATEQKEEPKPASLVCPACRRPFVESEATYTLGVPGAVPRCPEHGLAFVAAADLEEAPHREVLGRTIADRFTVTALIGSGSMGSVYRARQEAVGRDVALKIVETDRGYDDETRKRFTLEAQATSALVSPHTVTVFDFGETEDMLWIAMELLEGESLGARLRRTGALPIAEAVRITREAAKSLAEAHAKGIVHRDLKPDNLFLATVPDESGDRAFEVCKVLDFGIAKVARSEQRIDQLETQAGTVFGTPRYMSPEQAQGNPLDARSDLYSLGVLLYQMVAGRAPFVDDDAVVVMARHITEEPPPIAEVAPQVAAPDAVERVIRAALSKSPDERPQTAEQFIAALDRAVAAGGPLGSGVHATSARVEPANDEPGFRAPLRHRLAIAGGVTALVVLFGLGFVLVGSGETDAASVAEPTSPTSQPSATAKEPSLSARPAAVGPTTHGAPEPASAGDASVPARAKSHRAPPRRVSTPPKPRPKPAPASKYGRFE